MGGANIQSVHYFGHGYLEEEKSMIYTISQFTFGAKYLTGMVTIIPPYENYREKSIRKNLISEECHVTYSFINMLLISRGDFL